MSERMYGRTIIRDGKRNRSRGFIPFALFCLIVIAVGILIGVAITTTVLRHKEPEPSSEAKTVQISEREAHIITPPYGSGDNRVTEEDSFEWKSDESFIPLKVDMDKDLQEFVYTLSASYGIDWTLVMAMIEQESDYDTVLVSGTDDYGLMQINRCNHDELREAIGVTDFLDAEQNIRAGLYVLRQLFDKYKDAHRVLMAYNMGETGCKRLWENGVRSTVYSRNVTEKQHKYQKYIERRIKKNDD